MNKVYSNSDKKLSKCLSLCYRIRFKGIIVMIIISNI